MDVNGLSSRLLSVEGRLPGKMDNTGGTVSGSVTVTGSVTSGSATVSGPASTGGLTATSLTVNGPETVTGNLTVDGDFNPNGVGQVLSAWTTFSTTRSTAGSVTNDPTLQFIVSASAAYEVRLFFIYAAGAAGGGIDFAWTLPAGASGGFGADYNEAGFGAENDAWAWSGTVPTVGSPASRTVQWSARGNLVTFNSGTFALKWGAHTGGDPITGGVGSYLVANRIG